MKVPILVKMTLALSGLVAVGVGSGILFAPHAFHASAGLSLGDDVNLLNEMRASGGFLIASGLFMLFGAFKAEAAFFALVSASALYLTYGLSRGVSVVLDGVPNAAMLQIMALEFVIGAVCALMVRLNWSRLR